MTESSEGNLAGVLHALRVHNFNAEHDSASEPEPHCDLVMKGGITSGVVYPLAVLELAKHYRFRAIGGTSAGAIAAVVTAAAEYGRASGGFGRLIDMSEELQQPGFVANILQPQPELRPLLRLLFIVLKLGRRGKQQRAAQQRASKDAGSAPKPNAAAGQADHSLGAIAGDILKLLSELTFARKRAPAIVGGLLGALVGAIIGGGWVVASLTAEGGLRSPWLLIWGVLMIALFWWLGNLIGTAIFLIFTAIPRNFFGVCSGLVVQGHDQHRLIAAVGQSPALTDWLSTKIDRIAGVKGAPLTFGDLRNHEKGHKPPRNITLNTVTANISQGQPYILPFTEHQFLFSEEEWGKLFPPYIVEHMKRKAYKPKRFALPIQIYDDQGKQHNLHFLPESDDWPVVVAARMSLSFPILISAVPLWTISRETFNSAKFGEQRANGKAFVLEGKHMQRNWFSDGGTCSNFPIHFYDRLFPGHPTFGINLGDLAEEPQVSPSNTGDSADYTPMEVQAASDPDDADDTTDDTSVDDLEAVGHQASGWIDPSVVLPSSRPIERPGPPWTSLDRNLAGFVGAIINTGLFYRDIQQSRLPSYYDRIVTVLLSDTEGGINLDMPPETLERIAFKGHVAGQEIRQKFNFNHHRWVRFLVLLSQFEKQLMELSEPLFAGSDPAKREELRIQVRQFETHLKASGITHNMVQQLIDAQIAAFPDRKDRFPYARDQAWRNRTLDRLYALLLVIELWGSGDDAEFQLRHAPLKREEALEGQDHIRLRVTPEL